MIEAAKAWVKKHRDGGFFHEIPDQEVGLDLFEGVMTALDAVPPVHELTGHPMVGWGKLCGGIIVIHDPIVFSANEGLVTCPGCKERIDERNASKPARATDGRFAKRGSN